MLTFEMPTSAPPDLTAVRVTEWADYMVPQNQPKLLTTLRTLAQAVEARAQGLTTDPLLVYISGPTGTGKSTLANLIASRIPGNVVNNVRDGKQLRAGHFEFLMGNGFCWRTLIVDEAQTITDATAESIMGGLDGVKRSKRSVVIFTTMRDSCKAKPLFGDWDTDKAIMMRCLCVSLTTQGIKSPENVEHVLRLARAHGLDHGATAKQVENLFEANQNSIRGVLAAIGRGALAQA